MENIPKSLTISDLAEQAFGRNVRSLRVAAGMTQADLAEKMTSLGVSMRQTMVAKLERGARPTSVGEVTVLGNIFGVPPAVMLSDDTIPPDVTTLLDIRMEAHQVASQLIELMEQAERTSEYIELKRKSLATTVRLFDKTAQIVTENRGADWLNSRGVDVSPLATQDDRFERLLGDVKHPEKG